MAQSSLRIALPKKPSGSAGRFWPNHRIHVLKAKALLFSSDYGRGFGSVFHHHSYKSRLLSVGFFFARSPCNGGVWRLCLLSGPAPETLFFAPRTPLSVSILCWLWRKYPSWQASIDDHATFLKRNPRYKACFACTTAQAFAKTLAQAGYATDPAYADKVIGLIKQHNLLSLDGGAA